MGRLLQIEVENFKSYAGTQVIGPFHDFTCVVGPNGAGKSNLVDSISFVLGVQSRQLRSSTLKDLIFHKDDDSQPRRAVVRLLYQVSEGELEGFHDGDVVCFSRTVTNSSVSLYQFQNQNVTYEHYETILQKIGVLVKVRNFLVFQGDIEAVASKSPTEITSLFEQICGSDALAKEYDSLQVQKDEAEEKTIFAMQKKKMFQTQNKEVKVQRDEANLYNQKLREAKDLQTQLLACQLYQLQQEVQAQEESLLDYRGRIEENAESDKIMDDEVAEAKRQLAGITKRHGAQDKKLQGNKKKLEAVSVEMNQASSKIKILAKRKKEIDKNISNTEADLREQEGYIKTLSTNIDLTERELRLQQKELQALQAVDLHMSEDQIREYDQLKAQCNQETMSLTKQIQELNAQIQLLTSQRDAIQAQYSSAEKEGANQASLLADCQARLTKLASLSAGYEEEIRNQQQEKQRHVQNTSTLEKQLQEVAIELTAVTNKLNYYGSEKSRHTQNTKLADSIAVMSTLFEGIHGRLIDLCKPIQKKYHVAINIVLNKYFDAIVVDSKETATKCIAYLKEHHVGTATFLPLDSVQTTPIPQRFRDNLPSKYKLCLDVLEYDNAYRNAILYAVGNTVLCETLEDAQELAFQRGEQVKIVTLKGQVISRAGAMTGGHTQDLVRDRFQESEIQRLNQQRTALEQQKNQLEQQLEAAGAFAGRQTLTSLEQAIRALQAKIHYNGVDRTVLQEKIQGIQQQSALRQEQLGALARQLQDLTQQVDSVEQRKQVLQQQIQSVEETIFREFSNKMQVENVIQLESANQSQRASRQQQIQALTTQLSSLNSQLNYERSKQYSSILDKLHAQAATTTTELTTLEKELNRLKDQEEALLATNQQVKKDLQGLTNERELQMSMLKDILDRKADLASQTASYAKQVNALEITLEKLRNTLHNTLYNARLEQIPLPGLLEDSDAMDVEESDGPGTSREERKGALETTESEEETIAASRSVHFSDADHPVVRRDREVLNRVDLSMARKLLRGSSADRARKEQELREHLFAIQSEMSTMQPNLHAAQRYEESMKKLSECQYELDDLRTQAKTLSDRFEEVRAQRIHLFQACFQHVSKALSQVYRDLTKSSKHPLGGNAYLTLDNTDEPFTAGVRFTAMPPMKRFRDMDQLSGGEKTVAALALLFAIHSYRPAPFFVLDEIDAALDNVNVKKVCNYIAQRSSDLQCIVISLKDIFFEHAQSLVGIAKDLPTASSKAFTLDLQHFAESAEDASLEQSALEGIVGEDEDEAAEG